METKDAMKAVINSNGTTKRTGQTFADTDLIQLYDNNGNPNLKIAKSDFMDAVYRYLTSSSVASNLASVLGGIKAGNEMNRDNNSDLNDLPYGDIRLIGLNNTNRPAAAEGKLVIVLTLPSPYNDSGIQKAWTWRGEQEFYRIKTSGSWSSWKEVATV